MGRTGTWDYECDSCGNSGELPELWLGRKLECTEGGHEWRFTP